MRQNLVALLVMGLGCSSTPLRQQQDRKPEAPIEASVFPQTTPAVNRTSLQLHVDAGKVVGWITGTESLAGQLLAIEAGSASFTVTVADDNTFVWPYNLDKRTRARFRIGKLEQSATLLPLAQHQPSVFFRVDRPAYRPKQTLRFVGFLKQPTKTTEFAPLTDRRVEVLIRSVGQNRSPIVAKIPLRSDTAGRFGGTYEFSGGDRLGDYELSIADFKGTTTVRLGEFRKSKVKLVIGGKVAGDKLALQFDGRDFVDQPVALKKLDYSVAIVTSVRQQQGDSAFDPDGFAYADDKAVIPFPEELPRELRLVAESGKTASTMPIGANDVQVGSFRGSLDAAGIKATARTIALRPAWQDGLHSAVVSAVATDDNGREYRATQRLALENLGTESVVVRLSRHRIAAGDRIDVTAKLAGSGATPVTATIVASRLSSRPPGFALGMPGYFRRNSAINFRSCEFTGAGCLHLGGLNSRDRTWNRPHTQLEATVVAAAPLREGRGHISFAEPGVYRVAVYTKLKDGRQTIGRASCIVVPKASAPALALRLDRAVYPIGAHVKGTLHTRFADARMLLTLRDRRGVRAWKVIKAAGSKAPFTLTLPKDTHHEAWIEAHYADGADGRHTVDQRIQIDPGARVLDVQVKHNDVYKPGETVTLDISTGRREAVDLVVSVYDQSLLGIAVDTSPDIRSFFLADGRGKPAIRRARIRRLLGDLTLEQVFTRVRSRREAVPSWAASVEGKALAWVPKATTANITISAAQLAQLLRFSGVQATSRRAWGWHVRVETSSNKTTSIFELLLSETNGWRLAYQVYGQRLVLQPINRAARSVARGVRGRRGGTRGDAHYSHVASGNAMRSHASGQALYSHVAPHAVTTGTSSVDGIRRNFSDSAYWSSLARTDANGRASIRFSLPDSLTNWRVVVTALSPSGAVGSSKSQLRTFKPLMVWPMVPRSFTSGDRVRVFAQLLNQTDRPQRVTASLTAKNGALEGPAEATVTVPAKSRRRVYWWFRPGTKGFTEILMSVKGKVGSDASVKRLPVVQPSVEDAVTAAGWASKTLVLNIPEQAVLSDAELEITLAPSLLADMVDTLEYLVEYPHGCVEQTMSRFLPALRVAKTLELSGIEHPSLAKKLPGVVDAGVKRLLQLQRKDGGWGWYGRSATHEMMTPYALLGLLEAERAGYPIHDSAAINKGLDRLEKFIGAMGAAQASDRLYSMAVYARRRPLKPSWWKFIGQQQRAGKLSDYALALGLELAAHRGKDALASKIATSLAKRARPAHGGVEWRTAAFSRWGDDRFEITAAVLKALVAHDPNHPLIPKAVSFFVATKRGKRWNSTKDTAMIIYAFADLLAARSSRSAGSDSVRILVDGRRVGTLSLADGLSRSIRVDAKKLRGRLSIQSRGAAADAMLRAVLRYRKTGTNLAPESNGLTVSRNFWLLDGSGNRKRKLASGDTVPRGAHIEAIVTARPDAKERKRYLVIDAPKPAGTETLAENDQRFPRTGRHVLREDRTTASSFHFEQVPYGGATASTIYLAELSGRYAVSPASAELLYQTATRGHSSAFVLVVD